VRYFLGMSEPLSNIVEAGWADALAPVEDQIAQVGVFLREQIAEGKKYLPAGDRVLRAFKQPFATSSASTRPTLATRHRPAAT